jgi:ABC-type sugar transport system substrate-binding protein
MVKRILMVILVLTLAVSFGFAGGKTEKGTAGKAVKDLEIAVVYMNITNPFASFIKGGVDQATKELGINSYMTGATDWATESQYKVIEDLIAKKVDGISIAVLDIPGLTPIIKKGLDAGIPITCFNVDAPDSGRLGFVGEDLFLAGAETAKTLIEYMGDEGEIIVSSVAIGAIWSIKREEGVMSVLKNYPKIKIVDRINADGSEQQAYAALENALLAHPNIRGHVSFGGTQYLWGRLLANKNIGNMKSAKPIYCTGHDLHEEKLNQIKDGWSTAAFGQDPHKQGYLAVKQLYELIVNKVKPTVVDTGVIRVDAKNVDVYLKKLADGEPVG